MRGVKDSIAGISDFDGGAGWRARERASTENHDRVGSNWRSLWQVAPLERLDNTADHPRVAATKNRDHRNAYQPALEYCPTAKEHYGRH
jgi:hypothetical protein